MLADGRATFLLGDGGISRVGWRTWLACPDEPVHVSCGGGRLPWLLLPVCVLEPGGGMARWAPQPKSPHPALPRRAAQGIRGGAGAHRVPAVLQSSRRVWDAAGPVPASPIHRQGWEHPFLSFPTAGTSPAPPNPIGNGLGSGWLHPSSTPGIWLPALFPGPVPALRDEPEITPPDAGHEETLKLLPLPARGARRV